jgi:hypothetical protein
MVPSAQTRAVAGAIRAALNGSSEPLARAGEGRFFAATRCNFGP